MSLGYTDSVEIPADGSTEEGTLILAAAITRVTCSFRPGLTETIAIRPDGSDVWFQLRESEGMMNVSAQNAIYARSDAGATVLTWEER